MTGRGPTPAAVFHLSLPPAISSALRLLALAALVAACGAHAQEPVKVSVTGPAVALPPGGAATVRLALEIAAPYHIYSTLAQLDARGAGPIPTTVAVKAPPLVALAGGLKTSPAAKLFDRNFAMDVFPLEAKAWIDVPLKADAALKPGSYHVRLVVGYQACTEESCLPPQEVEVGFMLTVPAAATGVSADDPRWRELEQLTSSPPPLPGTAQTTQARAMAVDQRVRRRADLAWELYTAHPADPRRWQAFELLLVNGPRFLTASGTDEPARRGWEERLARLQVDAEADAGSPVGLREQLGSRAVSAAVIPVTNGELPADWSALEACIGTLAARFPEGRAAFVYYSRLVSAVEAQQPARLAALVERMATSPNAAVRAFAAQRRRVLQAMTRPLDFKFTALDGRAVDTAKWRGKVVLVDFWATWCGPCVQAMPHLKALYAKYHDRGLEIVNISVDNANARAALEKLVAGLELPWPQFFDGKASQTEYAVRYGVQPIPHVLLAGPDGTIVAVNPPGERLEAEIIRLLKL